MLMEASVNMEDAQAESREVATEASVHQGVAEAESEAVLRAVAIWAAVARAAAALETVVEDLQVLVAALECTQQ